MGHWLFAFRYFEVAEMLGRKDKSLEMHIKARAFTSKIRNCVIGFIVFVLGGIMIYSLFNMVGELNEAQFYIEMILLGIDVILMLFSLAWICHSLKDDKKVMGNEKYMAIHTILLLILLSSGILATDSYMIMRNAFNGLDLKSLKKPTII